MTAITKKYEFDEVFDSQAMYRRILTAMSNPTRVVNIKQYADKLYGGFSMMLAIAITLLDNEVSFNACGNDELAEEIVSLTLGKKETVENADYIFVTDPSKLADIIMRAKCGTLRDPHKSATIITINNGQAAYRIRLRGAGIKGEAELEATEIIKTALETRDEQFYEYPQGVDFIFVSDKGEMLSIPRLTLKEVV